MHNFRLHASFTLIFFIRLYTQPGHEIVHVARSTLFTFLPGIMVVGRRSVEILKARSCKSERLNPCRVSMHQAETLYMLQRKICITASHLSAGVSRIYAKRFGLV